MKESVGTAELILIKGENVLKLSSLLRALWTFLAIVSSFPILANTLGSAAWNGVNFVVCLYILASVGGTVGMLAGFCSAFSQRTVLKWITFMGALVLVTLGAIYAAGFIFSRSDGVPLDSPVYFGSIRAPILLLYAIAILCCLVEALLYFPGRRRLEARRLVPPKLGQKRSPG